MLIHHSVTFTSLTHSSGICPNITKPDMISLHPNFLYTVKLVSDFNQNESLREKKEVQNYIRVMYTLGENVLIEMHH